MRERPSCAVELRNFSVWRAAVLGVALTAIATLAAWAGLALANPVSGSVLVAVAAAALAVASAVAAVSLMRVEPGTLSSVDGAWSYTVRRDGAERIESGVLSVALDLGSFMLLTLVHVDLPHRRARRWLPVQRRGLESGWHALRCAVYSPPPVTPDRAAASGPLSE